MTGHCEPAEAEVPEAPGRLLVAEDDEPTRMLLVTVLSKAGYDVLEAEDGREALALIREHKPDLVISDRTMPQMDGDELCQVVKGDRSLGPIFFIMLSAKASTGDKVTGLDKGADGYLVKPIDRMELVAHVNAGMRIVSLEQELARQIEEERRLRKALQEEQRQLRETLDELHRTQAHLIQSEKMASLGTLAAGVAHEMNNPISFVASNLNTLGEYVEDMMALLRAHERLLAHARTTDDDEAARLAGEIEAVERQMDLSFLLDDLGTLLAESRDGIERVKRIVTDLRNLARADDEEFTPADLNDYIKSALNMISGQLENKAAVRQAYGDLPQIECCPGRLVQVFMNILLNAAQAVDRDGEITIETTCDTDVVRVRIGDNGTGIRSEDLPKVFDPFFTTKEIGQGTGLGLFISHGIVAKHHGEISVESEPGRGTTVTVTLPVKQGQS